MPVKSVLDQLRDQINFEFPPKRIVSLVPSQTELLADLGLEKEVIGITKFCVHPPSLRTSKTIIGGTKNFRFDTINYLKPDLIIGNKEENYQEGIHKLKQRYPVWMSDVSSYSDAIDMITSLGELTDRVSSARQINERISRAFDGLVYKRSASVLYLIWQKPWMAAANGTFIHAMLENIGLRNCLAGKQRYPELSQEEIRFYAPEYIFLSSEPYPFREEHIEGLKAISPASNVILVDGEMFSWYGSRLALAPHYFNSLPL